MLAPGEPDALSRQLMVDWVAMHSAGGSVWPALVAAAAAGGAPPEVPPPARERCAWGDAPVALSGAPLESADTALADMGVRCPRPSAPAADRTYIPIFPVWYHEITHMSSTMLVSTQAWLCEAVAMLRGRTAP